MILFIFAIILAIIAVVAFIVSKAASHPADRRGAFWVAIGVVSLAAVLLFFSCLQQVSTKNVGIETAFGKTVGHLSNGLHLTAPWVSVTEMDAAIQTDSYAGKDCLSVRIANQQTACVDISLRWRINPSQADYLFQNYRTFDAVRDSLVTRELRAALNNQLTDYNPLNSIQTASTVTGSNYPLNPSLTAIGTKVTNQMKTEIGGQGIEVLNTIIPIMTFDPQTQSRLNQLIAQQAQTRIATAAQGTAQAQAIANQDLANSVDTSPNVLVAQCLNSLQEMVKNNQRVPAGFTCWPTQGLTGVIAGSN